MMQRVLVTGATGFKGWSGVSAVADDRSVTWQAFFATLREHYARYRELRIPMWLAHLGSRVLYPLIWLRTHPCLLTPDTVVGWNLPLPVTPPHSTEGKTRHAT